MFYAEVSRCVCVYVRACVCACVRACVRACFMRVYVVYKDTNLYDIGITRR